MGLHFFYSIFSIFSYLLVCYVPLGNVSNVMHRAIDLDSTEHTSNAPKKIKMNDSELTHSSWELIECDGIP